MLAVVFTGTAFLIGIILTVTGVVGGTTVALLREGQRERQRESGADTQSSIGVVAPLVGIAIAAWVFFRTKKGR